MSKGNKKIEKKTSKKIKKAFYEAELSELQIELVKLQEWVRHKGVEGCCYF